MNYQPFRLPHGDDCTECYPPPSTRQILVMLAIVLTPAILIVLLRWTS